MQQSLNPNSAPETLPAPPPLAPAPTIAEIAHDARSLVTAVGLYCDLLGEPGVLAARHRHYLDELRLLSAATHGLVDKLGLVARLSESSSEEHVHALRVMGPLPGTVSTIETTPPAPIQDFAAELRALRNLVEAMAGPGIKVRIKIEGGEVPVRLTGEDLTRALVNLVKNAAEAMQASGTLWITLRERRHPQPMVLLSVEDNGPGVPVELRETIFAPRFSTKVGLNCTSGWTAAHRGLGLSITRSIVERAGGRILAGARPGGGARFAIELPIWQR